MNTAAKFVSFATESQKATIIIGTNVVTKDGQYLGHIKDMVVDPETSKVSYCVVAFGGFLGLGQKLFAIPFSALAYNIDEDEYVMNVPKHRMAAAAGFHANRWPAFADQQWSGQSSGFFNTPPYWNNTVGKRNPGKSTAA